MANYHRVIPRDLFNEANLLKCYGKLWINIEALNNPRLTLEHIDGEDFDIHQNAVDGSLYIQNVEFCIDGKSQTLFRPVNSREPWPLILNTGDNLEIEIFDNEGNFSNEFMTYIGYDSF